VDGAAESLLRASGVCSARVADPLIASWPLMHPIEKFATQRRIPDVRRQGLEFDGGAARDAYVASGACGGDDVLTRRCPRLEGRSRFGTSQIYCRLLGLQRARTSDARHWLEAGLLECGAISFADCDALCGSDRSRALDEGSGAARAAAGSRRLPASDPSAAPLANYALGRTVRGGPSAC